MTTAQKLALAVIGIFLMAYLTIVGMNYYEERQNPGPLTNKEVYELCENSTQPMAKCLDLYGR